MGRIYDCGDGGVISYYSCSYNNHKKCGNKKISNVVPTSAHKAPTVGLEKVLFTFGTTKDAAAFEVTKRKITQHVGIQSWLGAETASGAINNMEDHTMTNLLRSPVEKNNDVDQDSDNQEYTMEWDEYIKEMNEYRLKKG